ncbi:pilus assembly protein TadG-related protein [Sinimarinibacterium thermocellulolyticum]|uniref:Pilus assembly protein TadG-related protein n=1 Tax=Sinimarinibacterium thermocellulolyticum TaxID=3170016 RepID=A0ABV2AC42_9GAMM
MAQRRLGKGLHRQRGAVAVFAAIALVAMLTATMLAIDVGRMYVAKRELQKQAVLAALDASRLVSGCSIDADTPVNNDPVALRGEVETLVDQILAEAGVSGTVGRRVDAEGTPRGIDVGVIQTDAQGRRHLINAMDQPPDAVRVTLQRPFPTPILPLFAANDGQLMVASATAQQSAVGSFYLGSGLLRINTSQSALLNSLLSELLGGTVSIDAVTYEGLLGVAVSLEHIATALGLEAKDLSDPVTLGAQTPLLSDMIDGLAGALSGTASGAVTGLLGDLAAIAAGGNDLPVPLASLLGAVDDTAATAPFVNLLDLLIALGAAANADDSGAVAPIALPLALSLPGLASVHTFVQILKPPQFSGMQRAGVAEAHTAQIRLLVRLQVDALNSITQALNLLTLGGLLGQVIAPPIKLGVDVNVAEASAWLDRIQCPRFADPSLKADLSARAAVATIKLGTFDGAAANAPSISDGVSQLLGVTIRILGGLLAEINVNLFLQSPVETMAGSQTPVPLQTIDAFTKADQPAGERPYWIADTAPETALNPQTVGTTGLLSGTLSTLFSSLQITATAPGHASGSSICLLRVLGNCTLSIPVDSILDVVLNPVVTLLGTLLNGVGGIADAIIDPLLQALGIRIGSATVTMNAVSVDQPRIISTEVPASGF